MFLIGNIGIIYRTLRVIGNMIFVFITFTKLVKMGFAEFIFLDINFCFKYWIKKPNDSF